VAEVISRTKVIDIGCNCTFGVLLIFFVKNNHHKYGKCLRNQLISKYHQLLSMARANYLYRTNVKVPLCPHKVLSASNKLPEENKHEQHG
jgi:hypothetical protein